MDPIEKWYKVCREKLKALKRCNVYDVIALPEGRKVIKCCWVFDQKTDSRKKARLVAKEFSQIEDIHFDEIFCPVVRFESVYLILALIALEGWYISSLNVKSAFLYGKLNKEIYIQQSNSSKIKD